MTVLAEQVGVVRATLSYIARGDEKPVSHVNDSPDRMLRVGRLIRRRVSIRDARRMTGPASLDDQGFARVDYACRVTDFAEEAEWRPAYYAEVEAKLVSVTGADRVIVSDHAVRHSRCDNGRAGPVTRIHNDYTPRSALQRARQLLRTRADQALPARRFLQINLWRPLRGPVMEKPLALCNARSVNPRDLVATDLVLPNGTLSETYSLAYCADQDWYYFPQMRTDEALLIKCFDTETDGRARFTPHAAFDHLPMVDGVLPRESIEVRAFAFFMK